MHTKFMIKTQKILNKHLKDLWLEDSGICKTEQHIQIKKNQVYVGKLVDEVECVWVNDT